MWFTARFYNAAEADKMGLVNTVVPVSSSLNDASAWLILISCLKTFYNLQLEKLEEETVKWCREIMRNSPMAIRVVKSALNAVDDGHSGLQVPHSVLIHAYICLNSTIFLCCFSLTANCRRCNTSLLWN